MADIESVPCQFSEAWRGKCGKPSTNGWCSEHEGLKCVCCGENATRSCGSTSGPLCCGARLCGDCVHSWRGNGHVTKKVFDEEYATYQREEEAVKKSRTSPEQRCDPKTGLPINTFELLKGDWEAAGYRLKKVHYVALKHSLMGFFPAIISSNREMIISTDRDLIIDLWKLLPARSSMMDSVTMYVHDEKGVAYNDTKEQYDQERSTPAPLFNRQMFEDLLATGDDKPFKWAPGLISSDMNAEEFLDTIKATAEQFA